MARSTPFNLIASRPCRHISWNSVQLLHSITRLSSKYYEAVTSLTSESTAQTFVHAYMRCFILDKGPVWACQNHSDILLQKLISTAQTGCVRRSDATAHVDGLRGPIWAGWQHSIQPYCIYRCEYAHEPLLMAHYTRW